MFCVALMKRIKHARSASSEELKEATRQRKCGWVLVSEGAPLSLLIVTVKEDGNDLTASAE